MESVRPDRVVRWPRQSRPMGGKEPYRERDSEGTDVEAVDLMLARGTGASVDSGRATDALFARQRSTRRCMQVCGRTADGTGILTPTLGEPPPERPCSTIRKSTFVGLRPCCEGSPPYTPGLQQDRKPPSAVIGVSLTSARAC